MNNLIKNVAIWLVIALVLMTVFNQFSTRQAAAEVDGVLAVHRRGEAGQRRQGHHRGPRAQGRRRRPASKFTTYSPADPWLVSRPAQVRRHHRGQARGRAVAADEHLRLLVPDAAADRRVDLLHAPDAGRRARRRVLVRQEPRAHAGRDRPTPSPSPMSPAARKPRKKSRSWSSSCATRPSSRSSAGAFRAAC